LKINERLGDRKRINTFDILCVRRMHRIDETRPDFRYAPTFGSPVYSEAFIEWAVGKYQEDPRFFQKTRAAYRRSPLRVPQEAR
jgi:hypothetical protein